MPENSAPDRKQVKTKSDNQAAEPENKLDSDLVRYTRWLAIFTAALVFAAGLQFWAMNGQLGEMKATRLSGDKSSADQLAAIKAQAAVMQGQLDQMSVVTNIFKHQAEARISVRFQVADSKSDHIWYVTPIIKNIGSTDASTVSVWDSSNLFAPDAVPGLDFFPPRRDDPRVVYFTMGQGEERDLITQKLAYDVVPLLGKTGTFVVWGEISYADIFGVAHYERFCVRALPAPTGKGLSIAMKAYRSECDRSHEDRKD